MTTIRHPLVRQLVAQIEQAERDRPRETDRAMQQLAVDIRHRALLAAWYVGYIVEELGEHLLPTPNGEHFDQTTEIAAWFYAEGRGAEVEEWITVNAAEAARLWGDHELGPQRLIERALLGGFTVSEIEERFAVRESEGGR